MRRHRLAFATLLVLASPALSLDLIELKNGRIYQVDSARVQSGRLYMRLHVPAQDQRIAFAIPLEKVIPEFVYYIWAEQIDTGDVDQHLALAKWARQNGLFSHSWAQYQKAARLDPAVHTNLPKLQKGMYEDHATWIFHEAERLFHAGDVKVARQQIELILDKFGKSKEVGRSKALLNILAEREQFLSEQKRQDEIAARARKQQRRIDKYIDLIRRADKLVLVTRLSDYSNARRRLGWAGYAYRRSLYSFEDMMLTVEVDDLRKTLRGLIQETQGRIVRTFLKLGDLRWVTGDSTGALDAVHEVLALDPDNKAANGLRGRILDGGGGARRVDRGGTPYPYGTVYVHRLLYGHGGLGFVHPYGHRHGFSIRYGY